jgi:hypothetical protein
MSTVTYHYTPILFTKPRFLYEQCKQEPSDTEQGEYRCHLGPGENHSADEQRDVADVLWISRILIRSSGVQLPFETCALVESEPPQSPERERERAALTIATSFPQTEGKPFASNRRIDGQSTISGRHTAIEQ